MKKVNFWYSVLVIILFAALCFLTCYIIVDRNSVSNDENKTDNYENNNFQDVGKTEINIQEEGYNIKIVDGNIILKNSDTSLKLNVLNAKSLYYITYHEGGNYILFYITDDNKLYEIKPNLYSIFDNFSKDSDNYDITPILLSYNVDEFIGEKSDYFEHLVYQYVTVLDTNGNVQNVYFVQQDNFFGGAKERILEKID